MHLNTNRKFSQDTLDIINSTRKVDSTRIPVLTEAEINEVKCDLLSVFMKDRH